MELDANIRFSAITDMDGTILAKAHREGITILLDQKDTAASLKRASQAWVQRNLFSNKIGKGLYALAVFKELTRITFPIDDEHLLFISIGTGRSRVSQGEGGQQQIVHSILGLLSRDPTRVPTRRNSLRGPHWSTNY